jgi:hypothetical protein
MKHLPPARLIGLLVALVGCGASNGEAPLSGYAEAELVYLASGSAGTLQTLERAARRRVKAGQVLYQAGRRRRSPEPRRRAGAQRACLAQADNLRKGKRPLELQAWTSNWRRPAPHWPVSHRRALAPADSWWQQGLSRHCAWTNWWPRATATPRA